MDIGPTDDPLLEGVLDDLIDLEESKGAGELLGIILLVGVVVAVAGVVITLGSTAIQQTQGQSEIQHAENSFAEMDSQLSAVALGEGPNQRSISLGLTQQAESQVFVEKKASIQIERYGNSNDDPICTPYNDVSGCTVDSNPPVSEEIGYLVYKNGETEIAYQAGGIWRHNQAANYSYMLSPPPVEYQDATLTMPIIDVAGDQQGVGSSSITARQGNTRVPKEASGPVEEDIVVVRIESEYYEAWGNYFENHVKGNVDTCYFYEDGAGECNEDGELDENEIAIELGLTGDIHGSFDSAIVANGDVAVSGSGEINGGTVLSSGSVDGMSGSNVREYVELSLLELDPHIAAMMDRARSNYEDVGALTGGETLDHEPSNNGRYYVDSISLGSHGGGGGNDKLTINVSDGDVTLLVDGDISLQQDGEIEVVGANCDSTANADGEKCENHVRVLTNDDVDVSTGSPEVDTDGYPEAFQIYGGSDSTFTISQGGSFEGVIYAPSSSDAHGGSMGNTANCTTASPSVCVGASATVDGAIVGGSTVVANGAEVNYDPDLANFNPTVSPDMTIRPRLMNLHVSVNNVSIDG